MAEPVVAATDRPLSLEEKKAAARERARRAREERAAGTAEVGLTPAAAAYVRETADAAGRPHAMRLRVLAGGCSGLEYKLDLLDPGDAPRPDERELVLEGIRLLLDTRSAIYVTGSVIDYESTLLRRGFKITNPNAVTTCSCGTSFGVAAR